MRPFEPADDEAVVALFARIYEREPSFDTFDLNRWRAFRALPELDEGRKFLVVERDSRIVALSTLRAFVDKDNLRAQRLYARAGFVLDREAFTYRKKIS